MSVRAFIQTALSAPASGMRMQMSLFALWVVLLLTAAPGMTSAAVDSVPAPCGAAMKARWPEWRLSPPPRDFAAYAKQQRIEPNVARADFDSDGIDDVAVLLLTSATRTARRHLVVCLTRGAEVDLHVIREPYCGDGIVVTPKGTKAGDHERETNITYRANGIHTVCFEKAGATYIFDKGRFRRVVDSD